MKKLLLLFTLLIAGSLTFAQSDFFNRQKLIQRTDYNKLICNSLHNKSLAAYKLANYQKLDSSIVLSKDTTNWEIVQKAIYQYDLKGNTTSITDYDYETINDSVVITPDTKDEYIYDTQNRITEHNYYEWDYATSQLSINDKTITTYPSNTTFENVYYHQSSSQLKKQHKDVNYYSSSINHIDSTISYHWNSYGNHWVLSNKQIYSYFGNLLTSIKKQQWTGTAYQNDKLIEYTYDAAANQLSRIKKSWNSSSNQYYPNDKVEYQYTSSNKIKNYVYSEYDLANARWQGQDSIIYTIDNNGNASVSQEYIWESSSNSWRKDIKLVSTYNNTYALSDLLLPNEFQDKEILPYFNHMNTHIDIYEGDNNQWEYSNKYDLYYSNITINSIRKNKENIHFSLYPNPAQSSISIRTNSKGKYQLKVYAINGSLVKHLQVNNNSKVDIKSLNKGIYILQLTDNKGNSSFKKLIKQ